MTLLKAGPALVFFLALSACVSSQVNLHGEMICRAAAGDSLCPKLSHFESELLVNADESWELYVAYDFAQSRKATWYDSLDRHHVNLPPQTSWLAGYGLNLKLEPRWSLHIEDSSGTTLLPNGSYLAFSHSLQDIGWKQTVARLNFTNPAIFTGDLLLGLGEGERLNSDDGDLYYGAQFRWYVQKAAALQLAFSQDNDSLSKDSLWWLDDRAKLSQGFSTQRLAVSLSLNGQLPAARGLEASVGWQDNRVQASSTAAPFARAPTELALEPTELLAQNFGGQGETRREAWLASASYRILAEYLIAIHAARFRGSLQNGHLQACRSLDAGGGCLGPTEKSSAFLLRQTTYGLGKIDNDGWSFLLESHEERYDRLYQNYHFLNGKRPRQKNLRLLQARIQWQW